GRWAASARRGWFSRRRNRGFARAELRATESDRGGTQQMTATVKTKAPIQRTEHPHIVKSEDIIGGTPRVEGTRFSVLQVLWWSQSGLTPEYVIENFPPLTLAQYYDALSYAYDHPD